MSNRAIVINVKDNVANMIGPACKGQDVECVVQDMGRKTVVSLLDDIPSNHKFAFRQIKKGDPIIKYGLSIGKATVDIEAGNHVHTHNIESNRGRGDLMK